MVKRLTLILGIAAATHGLHADITINATNVDLSGTYGQQLISKLDSTMDQLFYAVASLAGPGIANSAAFSSTIGIQRQNAELQKFQLEPSVALILPSKGQGDEKINALPLYAVNLVGGYRFSEKTALSARAFYLPEITVPVKDVKLSMQPYNFGLTLTQRIKPEGKEWYNPAILTPVDFAYMHGALTAKFDSSVEQFTIDPIGDGSTTATAKMSFSDEFKLKWDVYTFTTGFILEKPIFQVLSARIGLLSSMNLGNAQLQNTATGTMTVTSKSASGSQAFNYGDTASITVRNSAAFKPLLVSNQIVLGTGLALGAAAANVNFMYNLQFNAVAINLQFGCWF